MLSTCEYCGSQFERRKNHRFCSLECGALYQRKRISLTCQYCNNQFEVPASRSGRKYCSKECATGASRKQTEQICERCGKSFSIQTAEVKRGGGKYCSTDCFYAASKTGNYRKCPSCGKELYISFARGVSGKTFCSKPCAAEYHRAYKINYDFFNAWTLGLAYLWGLWSADGFITRRKFCICLKEKDHLEVVGRLFCDPPPIRKGHNVWELSVGSRKLVELLEDKLGAQERKSLVLKWPPRLPEGLEGHFCRGYFDGDGYVSFMESNRRLKVGITTGSEEFANELNRSLLRHGIRFNLYRYKYSVLSSGNAFEITRFYSWIYEGAGGLFLDRKKKIFDRIYESRPMGVNTNGTEALSYQEIINARQIEMNL